MSPAQGTPGFEACYGGNGVVVSINLFGDRVAAEESTRGAAELVSWNLADLIRLPPQVLTGEIVAQRTPRSLDGAAARRWPSPMDAWMIYNLEAGELRRRSGWSRTSTSRSA